MSGLSIELPKLYYTTGEVVKGKVVFKPKTDRKIHGIHIHFTGFEFCENSLLSDVPFQKKWILDGSTTVYGNKCVINRTGHQTHTHRYNESEGVTIKSGNYIWPFSFQIPKSIPPSADYKGGKVKIEYTIVALVDIPWAKSIRTVHTLRVGLPYVLDPARAPSIFREEKSFLIHAHATHDPSRPHLLKMEGYTDKPVTYTGDKLLIHVKLDNNSGRNVQGLKIKLKQLWSYGAGTFEKYTITKVKHKDNKFPLQQGPYQTDISIIVPNCDLRPTIQNASLIRVGYHVTVIATIRTGGNLRVRIPIVMASFPPLIKGQEKKEEKKEKKEKKTKKEKEEKDEASINPILIDWDAPVPEQIAHPVNAQGIAQPLMPMYNMQTGQFMMDMGPNPIPPAQVSNVREDEILVAPQSPIPSRTHPYMQSKQFQQKENEDFAYKDVKPPAAVLAEMTYNASVGGISDIVNEMDAAIQWASSGQLEHAIETDPAMSIGMANSNLAGAVAAANAALARLVNTAKLQVPEDYVASVQDVASQMANLTQAVKDTTTQIGDNNAQRALLQNMKAVALGAQQLVLQGKEITSYDPFTSAYSMEFMVDTMGATHKNTTDYCNNLVPLAQKAFQEGEAKVNFIKEAEAALANYIANYNNPFGDGNPNASINDLEASAQTFAAANSQFVISCHGNDQDISQGVRAVAVSMGQFLANSKGVAKTNPTLAAQLNENSKAAAAATSRLLAVASNILTKGQLTNSEDELGHASKESQVRAATIINMCRNENQRILMLSMKAEEQKKEAERRRLELEKKKKEESDLEDSAAKELAQAAQAIVLASNRLRDMSTSSRSKPTLNPTGKFVPQRVDHKADVMDASSSVAVAIGELLKAAALAQDERAKNARDTQESGVLYHRDPAWTAGLVSASKQVVDLINQLVDATGVKDIEEEVVVSLAKAISAATAHLMSAERAKGDPDSEAHRMLSTAARAVAGATAELVQKVKDIASQQIDEEVVASLTPKTPKRDGQPGTPKTPRADAAARVKELEAAVRIAKLEKELERARLDMHTMRKDKYTKE